MAERKRLDVLVTEAGLAPSREAAKRYIMAGEVFVNGEREDKPGSTFKTEGLVLELKADPCPYVSRGGYKLEKALKVFPVNCSGKRCLDIGASTGGFTDCLLQNGAEYVCAVDSGTNQLAWKLRSDERVKSMERCNFRYLTKEELNEEFDLATADVSFISLSKILPAARGFLKEGGEMICLIKPQFEAGRENVGKKGVVRDPKVHREVIGNVLGYAREAGFYPAGLDYSPIKGPEGNIEYLLYLKTEEAEAEPDIAALVAEAGEGLGS